MSVDPSTITIRSYNENNGTYVKSTTSSLQVQRLQQRADNNEQQQQQQLQPQHQAKNKSIYRPTTILTGLNQLVSKVAVTHWHH
jgi:hypothetical protein